MPDFNSNNPDSVANSLPSQRFTSLIPPGPGAPPAAAIIGPSVKGPAFVPFDLSNNSDFESVFGSNTDATNGKFYSMLGVERYFNSGDGTVVFLRTLGIGDGEARSSSGDNKGRVNNAGFLVGQEIVDSGTQLVGNNPYVSSSGGSPVAGGALGRTYFLAALMSESDGSTIFSDAGIQTSGENISAPIIRGMLFAPSGVILSLSSNLEPNNSPTWGDAHGEFGVSGDGGCNIGTVNSHNGASTFALILNGHKSSLEYPSVVSASFEPTATYQDLLDAQIVTEEDLPFNKTKSSNMYFSNVFNTDPTKIQEAGHYLYTHYDIHQAHAGITGSGVITEAEWGIRAPTALLLTSSLSRNTGSVTDLATNVAGIPNFENFQDRFSQAFSPFVISQEIDRSRFKLFRLHAFSDGPDFRFMKFIVRNIRPGGSSNGYTEFDIVVYSSTVADTLSPTPLETFEKLDLDPGSDNFIARRIGDRHAYYMFDTDVASRKLNLEGHYPLQTELIRVECTPDVWESRIPKDVVPVGFSGIHHLITSATNPAVGGSILTGSFGTHASSETVGDLTEAIKGVIQPPFPFTSRLSSGVPGSAQMNIVNGITWGAQYSRESTPQDPNLFTEINKTISSLTTFIPNFHTELQNPWVGDNPLAPDVGGCVFDADRFNNNMFTLENVIIITGSSTITPLPPGIIDGQTLPHPDEWPAAIYSRNRKLPATLTLYRSTEVGAVTDKIRFVNPSIDFLIDSARAKLSFAVPFQGGFNGLDIFNAEAQKMSDLQVFREKNDPTIGNADAVVALAFKKAIEIMVDRSNTDIALLSIPGIRHRSVTDKIVEECDDNFGAMAVLDVEEFDSYNAYVTSSLQEADVKNTSHNFAFRAIGSSFVAAYYPNVIINFDPDGLSTSTSVPASVAALGAIAYNDKNAGPYYAPMGLARGVIEDALDVGISFLNSEKAQFSNDNINIIGKDPNLDGIICPLSQLTCYGNKTSLDKINVRRMLIDVRRKVRHIARNFLMKPATQGTRDQFESSVSGYLNGLVGNGAIESFRFQQISPSVQPDELDPKNRIELNIDRFKVFGNLLNRKLNSEQELKTIRANVFIRPLQSDEIVKFEIEEGV